MARDDTAAGLVRGRRSPGRVRDPPGVPGRRRVAGPAAARRGVARVRGRKGRRGRGLVRHGSLGSAGRGPVARRRPARYPVPAARYRAGHRQLPGTGRRVAGGDSALRGQGQPPSPAAGLPARSRMPVRGRLLGGGPGGHPGRRRPVGRAVHQSGQTRRRHRPRLEGRGVAVRRRQRHRAGQDHPERPQISSAAAHRHRRRRHGRRPGQVRDPARTGTRTGPASPVTGPDPVRAGLPRRIPDHGPPGVGRPDPPMRADHGRPDHRRDHAGHAGRGRRVPPRYDTDPPPLADYAAAIRGAAARLPYPVQLACEPGRAIAAPAAP